jgi:hypothetical protein
LRAAETWWHQVDARDAGATFDVILAEDTPAGRLLVVRAGEEIRMA